MARASLPLRYRLPNPPPSFVGRREETTALGAAIRRSAVSVVWGLGGVGKTSLVRKVLASKFGKRVPRTIEVALAPDAALEAEVLRALAFAVGGKLDWSELSASPDAAAAAIDLAEAAPWWIVVEDLHHADAGRAAAFLALFARYARRARLIATTRVEPGLPAGVAEVLPLGAMKMEDLEALARRALGFGATEAKLAARAASGSPWRLLQRDGGDDTLGIPAMTARFLARAVAAGTPLPEDAFAALESPEEPEALVARGLLERSGLGYRVHDAVRGLLPAADRDTASRARADVGRSLAKHRDPIAALEGVRLLLDAGAPDEAARALLERGMEILESGQSPGLWAALDSWHEPRLESLRLRCAADFGAAEALARVDEPATADPDDLLEWARVLRLRGDLARASEVAARIPRSASRKTLFEAGLLRLRCLIVQGAASDVLTEAEKLDPPGADDLARRDSLVAQALAYAGRSEEANTLARELAERARRLSPTAAIEVCTAAARTLYDASHMPEVDKALEEVLDRLGPIALSRTQGRLALMLKAYLLQDWGRLEEAAAIAARLAPGSRTSLLSAAGRYVDGVCRMANGDLDGLDDALAAEAASAEKGAHRNFSVMAMGMRVKLATIAGRAAPRDAVASDDGPDPMIRNLRLLWRLQNEGRHASRGELPGEVGPNVEGSVLLRIVSSEWKLLSGDLAGAVRDARVASDLAHETQLRLVEAEALAASCDALLVSGRDADCAAAAKALEALARAMPAARFSAEARFHRAILANDPAALEPLGRGSLAPARRARMILEGAQEGDALDRVVVDACLSRDAWRDLESLPPREGSETWGIDETRTSVWLADGRVVPFAKKLLPFQVLVAIAERGGSATKEDLVRTVWREAEYHRLRHDNRLHLAILKARRAIEDDPSKPARLLATADGYALAGRVRRKRRKTA